MGNLPIVLIHTGQFKWMPAVISQVREHGNENIFLIGDSNYKDFEEYCPIEDYLQEFELFERIFVNLSSNNRGFELACFRRWFVLYRFMKENQIPLCFHPDTDVLIYCDLTKEYFNKFMECDLTLIKGYCGASTFITVDRVKSFVEYVLNIYLEKGSTFSAFTDMYAQMQRDGRDGGVCDMTLWKSYRERFNIPFAEMTEIINNETYDHVLKSLDGYDDQAGAKYVEFHDGLPYCRLMPSRKMIRFMTLHMQGEWDSKIPEFIERAHASISN